MFALISGEPVPAVSTAQMREIDRSMPRDFGIDLVRMMENVGRNPADPGQPLFTPRTVIVLAGPGGNGGGGRVAARHLHNRGGRGQRRAGRPAARPRSRAAGQHRDPDGHPSVRRPGDSRPGHRRADRLRAARLPPAGAPATRRLGQHPVGAGGVPRRAKRPGPGHRAAGGAVRARGRDHDARAAQDQLVAAEAAGRLYLANISVPQLLYQQMAWWYRPCSITADVELNVAPTDKPGAVRR